MYFPPRHAEQMFCVKTKVLVNCILLIVSAVRESGGSQSASFCTQAFRADFRQFFLLSEEIQCNAANPSSGKEESHLKILSKVMFRINFKNTTCAASLRAVVTILSCTKPDRRSSSGH